MNITDQIAIARSTFKFFLDTAERYSKQDLVLFPAPVKSPNQPGVLSVTWHDKTGLIIAEKPGLPGVYEIYVPDTQTGLDRGSVSAGATYECYAVGDLLVYDKNVTQPDSSVIKVQTFKVRYYSKTPDRFKNYVDNTIRISQQTQ